MRRPEHHDESPRDVPYEDDIGRPAALVLHAINVNRAGRGRRALTPYEWERYGELARVYQDTTDPDERADAIRQLGAINGDPEGYVGTGIPEHIRNLVRTGT